MKTKPKDWLKLACIIVLAIILFASAAQAISLLFMYYLMPQVKGFFGILKSVFSAFFVLMFLLTSLSLFAIIFNKSRFFYPAFILIVVLGMCVALT